MKDYRLLLIIFVALASQPGVAQNMLVEKSIQLSTGVTLQYVESGNKNKTPILLLHGYTDSWRSFMHVMTKFSDDYYVVAISHRGHGESSKPDAGYQLNDFARDIAAFISQTGLKECVVVGHSLGGLIAQQFAITYPQHTRALVLVSTDACFADNPGVPEFLSEVKKLTDPIDFSFADSFQRSTIFKSVDSAHVEMFIRESLKVPAKTWAAIADELIKIDLTQEIQEIRASTLVLWGNRDAFCPQVDQQHLTTAIPQATLKVYPETGHAIHWEDGEQFVSDIETFIENLK